MFCAQKNQNSTFFKTSQLKLKLDWKGMVVVMKFKHTQTKVVHYERFLVFNVEGAVRKLDLYGWSLDEAKGEELGVYPCARGGGKGDDGGPREKGRLKARGEGVGNCDRMRVLTFKLS